MDSTTGANGVDVSTEAKLRAELALIQESFSLEYDPAEPLARPPLIIRKKTGLPAKLSLSDRYRVSEWIDGRTKTFIAARIIFGLHHGYLPDTTVDHVNRNALDDAISNLRPATRQEQQFNQGPRRRPKHPGLPMGVHRTPSGKYRVRIGHNGKERHLGTFATIAEAREAYNKAKLELRGEAWAVRTKKPPGRKVSVRSRSSSTSSAACKPTSNRPTPAGHGRGDPRQPKKPGRIIQAKKP